MYKDVSKNVAQNQSLYCIKRSNDKKKDLMMKNHNIIPMILKRHQTKKMHQTKFNLG